MLLLHANEPVSRDRLIDGIWGEQPPATAAHTLDGYVSRLRKLLGADRLTRKPPGYRLRVEPGELDLERFEKLAAEGRHRDALAVWRGPALADLLYEPFAGREAERLEERRLSVLEDLVDANLAAGGGRELVTELEALVHDHPYRERLLGQLILALYRSGQQARALDAYRSAKRRLAEELGLEPGPRLQELEQAILEHAPALGATASEPHPPVRRRRAPLVGVLVAAAVAVGAAIGIVLGVEGTSASKLRPGANQLLGFTLNSAAPDDAVLLDHAPAAIAAGEGSLWLADPAAGAVCRVDPDRGTVVDRIQLGGTPGAVAVGGGSVWAASVLGDSVARIDPATGTVTQTIRLGGAQLSALAFGAGGLWVADLTDNSLLEVDPASGVVRRTVALQLRPSVLAIGAGGLWVADYEQSAVSEVDPSSGSVLATVRVGTGPSALAVGADGVWVANALDSTVSRIDPATASVVAKTPVGSGPAALAVANRSVWVADQYAATVSRIDPSRNAVVESARVGGSPTALAVTAGRLWVSTRSLAQHRGGTLVLLNQEPIKIDPALQFNLLPLASDRLTRDSRVTYADTPGPTGIRIVPDLAIAIPLPTDGGTTYVFRLRPGIRYSDGRPVHASDVRRAIERLFRLGTPLRLNFSGMVGADACTATRCDLSSGIVADNAARTVTFHLQAPDPGFLANLTTTAASPVPPGTPWRDVGLTPIPGTGPYRIASATARETRWARNPFFREWSHAAQPDGNPDEIVLRFGLRPAQEIREIEAGHADWTEDFIPPSLLPQLRTHYAAQLHAYAIPTTDFFFLNTHIRPFDDIRVRRALNLAVDRREIARLYGGPDFATPTCQVLPPGVAGYHRYCPYTRDPNTAGTWNGPDLVRARRLVAASGTRGTTITVWGWTDDPTISPPVVRYTAGVLRRLGYRARIRLVPHSFFDHQGRSLFPSVQLAPYAWGDTSYGYFATWFACEGSANHGWFCDRRIDRRNHRALSLAGTDPRGATSIWTGLDRELVDRAVCVPMINEGGLWLVSARVRNYQSHPYWGLIADQLWVC